MQIITYISNLIIPIIIFYIVGYGMLTKTDIFDSFVKGAVDGIKVVVNILPTLIGLLIAIYILRESGVLVLFAKAFSPAAKFLHFPAELVPLSIIKMISSSAATGLLLDVYKSFGTDSREGYMASLLMCCSETIFYTISVYFMATKDSKHKAVTGISWLLTGALIATFAGMAASVVITDLMGI